MNLVSRDPTSREPTALAVIVWRDLELTFAIGRKLRTANDRGSKLSPRRLGEVP
jgi:hypothetical protein